ncbi:glycosyltransferase family 2 protein [Aequorivita antarctica]|uniref:Glycosyltransferase family 2 protein n=1 Tax=Aequorivita antarctica TaxID=153266 RepID=A0A5C6YXX3_9FLAO|nr:glycosyltransferase family 2 protein [Aequorivita antarctica]TXD72486.1 glycosyltransferase family 2 protein [Aequorivita antarctica]SRX75620.1 Putative glycosyltransferase EpsE [Aequorivita antarctica]
MKVSVILPVFNGEKTLEATLKSLAAQTFQDFELVVCIDGTNDGSQDILSAYKSVFQSIIILKNQRNLGLGPTMNRLVSQASGEYIAIAEQDDYYYPDRLQLEVDLLDAKSDIGLVSGIAEFWGGEKVTSKFPGILVHGGHYPEGKELFLLNYRNQIKVVNSCIMFRKSVHIDNGLYFTQHHPSISVDWTYILRFSLVSKIYGLQEILVRLDRRSNRASVTSNKKKQFAATRELLRSFAYEYPHIVSKSDYQYAVTTQHLMELSNLSRYRFPIAFIRFYLFNPGDNRWLSYLKKKFKRYFAK